MLNFLSASKLFTYFLVSNTSIHKTRTTQITENRRVNLRQNYIHLGIATSILSRGLPYSNSWCGQAIQGTHTQNWSLNLPLTLHISLQRDSISRKLYVFLFLFFAVPFGLKVGSRPWLYVVSPSDACVCSSRGGQGRSAGFSHIGLCIDCVSVCYIFSITSPESPWRRGHFRKNVMYDFNA